jgi:glycosyltransferase involved in cell wall biosynthesis
MLRILYGTDLLMAGGVERQLTELVTRLDRTRFDPHVMCLYGERAGRSLHFSPQLRKAGIPLYLLDLGWSPADKLRGLIRIGRITWRVRPQILHVFNYHSNLLARIARPFLPPSIKLIGSVRTLYSSKQLLYERLSQWTCTVIICNSPHLQQSLIEQARIPATKVICIPNGVDMERFAQNPNPALSKQVKDGAGRVLVMFGRITQQKSQHLLAQALGIVKERGQLPTGTRAVIVGEQQDSAIQALLEDAIRRNQLDDVVVQYSQTKQPEAFYHATDVIILATLWEGLPNVALESLASGHPVVISEAANAARIIEHGVTGWVVQTGDVESLAETLHLVLTLTDDQLAGMRDKCLRRAADFAVPRMVEHYETLYHRLRAIPKP